nr:immunoglobulin light chain junction region [Macaca mulatta]MOY12185.1 immunoglobulin light chain junction region [Macaca mulatta]MOY13745.1 immunoglobulin light chain junction region [Macaca mulatta]MOY13770.1 immunoglobulin light chain junction region [Macaca mulatta]MOY14243.1 immunoglobulin light chain junction region [Macaca mulatta]
CLQTKDFPFSF